MEMRVSSPKPSLAPSDSVSDPEEKEVSDEDDDDRNHKHRRREDRSLSLERDVTEPVMSRPFRKRNKTFGNRQSFRENESQAFEMIKRRPGLNSIPRAPLDMNQRLRPNQSFSGDLGAGRGRGRELGSWNQRDSRFSSIDVASQMMQQGPIPSSLYSGRGLPNVSNAQNASWNAFGLIPGVPNGGLDMLRPIGLQGALRPPINSSISLSIPRQRCRDFEERGFCLRGDMCPMEHGVNRIVIEDVQSLSQFNLPVSLPSAHLMGAPAGSGSLHSISATTTSMNSKGIHGKASKSGIGDDGLVLGGAYLAPGGTSGADFYDPDQPLWNDSGLETSNALLNLQSSKIDETEPFSSDAPSDRHNARLSNAPERDSSMGTSRTFTSQSASSSVWARIGGSKNRSDVKEKVNPMMVTFQHPDNQLKEDNDELNCFPSSSQQVKQIIADDVGPKSMGSTLKAQTDIRNIRKPSQKALRTLFVNGIPHKSNRRDALLSHFQKFGEVIDIHIPLNSERAFVQFSKREEAEAALKAPDAVMGNRFIKLWWANRDSIPDDSISSGNGVTATTLGHSSALVPSHTVVSDRSKDIHQATAPKTVSDAPPAPDQPKLATANGPKTVPPLQKKLENLEQLKEELRKKQEMLDQKRNEFRRHLNKLEKQATGLKGEVVTEQAAKRPKTGLLAGVKLASQLFDSGFSLTSPHAETIADKNNALGNPVSHSPKAIPIITQQESTALKPPIRPYAPVNRYKLDNRPTSFRIIPPLPAGLANAAVLKEHFSPYGEISAVELEDVRDHINQSEARISFTTRQAAERAFINGKSWKEHSLKFMWLTPSNSSSDRKVSNSKEPVDTDDHPEEKDQVMQETNISGDKEPSDSGVKSCLEHTDDHPEDYVMAEASTSEDEEPSNSGTKNSSEHTETGEDRQCSQTSSAEQSPEGNVC
ncbi:zinc finger CCCH domain-containing protein 41 isoform X1 [Prosopis cineraria]|uniref:zinc finger CCCH domain-containing protein 41 isoform X1 n=1 Tax=Prosopis cineraria TaxID=364024 RepID=UPI0024101308|nr:zinc finger CCCH domain-containing protein 41 isoform X1 [Prosopis cineraria]XP_054815104.1 zinc finger CCCH domain-containing protein 41 isoform X1 [Prosopis cineraria]